jgi:hypothetical protein
LSAEDLELVARSAYMLGRDDYEVDAEQAFRRAAVGASGVNGDWRVVQCRCSTRTA